MLHEEGFHVFETQYGEETLQLAHEHRPHLIVLDMHMPPPFWPEVMQQLQADPIVQRIPVIGITPFAWRDAKKILMEAGFAGGFPKPYSKRVVLSTVAGVLTEGTSWANL